MKQRFKFVSGFLIFTLSSMHAFGQVHTIQKRESLSKIARMYNMTPFDLTQLNPHVSNGINEGEVIRVSKSVPKEITLYDTYKVSRKETLFGIGQKLGISVEDIKKNNPILYSNELRNRQILLIPVHYPDQAENKADLKLTYTVRAKDTKWRIAYLHGMTLGELKKLNPDLGETLSIGQVLVVANPENKEDTFGSEKFESYVVKPKETLFSLTKTFGLSEAELKKWNPDLENGLKAGMVLKIPAKTSKTPAIHWQTVNLADQSFSGEGIKLAVMLPFGLKEMQADTLLNFKKRFKTDRNLDVTTEFYSGVLMAIDSAKSLGLEIDSSVFDTENSEAKVSQIIRSNQLDRADAIVGPLYQKNFERAAELLKDTDVKIFSPLTNREIKLCESCFQTLPTPEILEAGILDYLQSVHTNENIVVVTDRKLRGVADRIKSKFPTAFSLVADTTGIVKQALVMSALSLDRSNWILLASENVTLLSTLIPKLVEQSVNYKITLMTTDRNRVFEGDVVSSSHLAKLHFQFPSVEKPLDTSLPNPFVNRYFHEFGVVPGKYAVRGFDLTFDVLMRLATTGDRQKKIDTAALTEYFENKFKYDKNPTTGYSNKAFYILKYDGYNLIEVRQ